MCLWKEVNVMPNIKSAKKRVLTSKRKCGENTLVESRMKNSIKKLERTIKEGNKEEKIELPKSNVVKLFFENGNTITVRPSGTEPKVKFYIGMKSKEKIDKSASDKLYEELKKALKIE